MSKAFPFIQQWALHKETVSALLPSLPHLSQFSRKCPHVSLPLPKNQALKFPTEMQYADDTYLLSTIASYTHLEEVMDVLDREFPMQPRQDTEGTSPSRRNRMAESEDIRTGFPTQVEEEDVARKMRLATVVFHRLLGLLANASASLPLKVCI